MVFQSKKRAAAAARSLDSVAAGGVLLNTAFSYLSFGADTLVLLVLTPFIIRSLGVERFGVWSLLWSVLSLAELVHLGMSEAVVKFVATARGANDSDGHRENVAALFWGYVAQGTVLVLLTAGIFFGFDHLFTNIPDLLRESGKTSLLLLGLAAAVGAPLSVFNGVLLAHQRQWQSAVAAIVIRVVHCVAVFVLLPGSPSLVTLALLSAASSLTQFVVVTVIARLTIPALSISPRKVKFARVKEIYSYSLHFTLITAAFIMATRVDSFIIERWLDVKAVGIYALALRVNSSVDALATRVQRVLTPIYAELHGKGERETMVSHLLEGSRLTFVIAVPMAGGAMILATPLVTTWIGPEMEPSGAVLSLLLASVLTGALYEGVRGVLSMIGHHRLLARTIFLGQLLNVVLSIALVKRFGLLGVAAGTVLGMVPMDLFVFQRTLTKELGVTARQFLAATVLPSLLPGVVSLGALFVVGRLYAPPSLFWVAVYQGVTMLLFGVLFWNLSATPADKDFLRTKFAAVSRRLPGAS